MSTGITINVTAANIKAKGDGNYKGDFTFTQTAGTPTVVDDKGNIDLKDVTGEADITFTWGSPTVTIDGVQYAASYYYADSSGRNIKIAKGKDSDPLKSGKNPPLTGSDEFIVNYSNSAAQFTLVDKNADGDKYAYCMVAFVNIAGGRELYCDPKILNKPD